MLDRRSFTFGALLTVVSRTAHAGGGIEVLPPDPYSDGVAPDPMSLEPIHTVRRKGDEVHIGVKLKNVGPEAIDLQVDYTNVRVTLDDGVQLDQVHAPIARRAMVSRIAPLPRYTPVAAGATVDLGTYRYTWAADLTDVPLEVTVRLVTGLGEVALPTQYVQMAPART